MGTTENAQGMTDQEIKLSIEDDARIYQTPDGPMTRAAIAESRYMLPGWYWGRPGQWIGPFDGSAKAEVGLNQHFEALAGSDHKGDGLERERTAAGAKTVVRHGYNVDGTKDIWRVAYSRIVFDQNTALVPDAPYRPFTKILGGGYV